MLLNCCLLYCSRLVENSVYIRVVCGSGVRAMFVVVVVGAVLDIYDGNFFLGYGLIRTSGSIG